MATPCKNEFRLIVRDEAQTAEVTLPCHLSPEISAVDMEIRWFKGTDCVCLYMEGQMIAGVGYKGRVGLNKEMERGNISLELKDVSESDDGDYLCQVTSGDRTEVARLSLKTHEVTEILQTENTTPEQNDKKKMENSVLMAVFTELKDTKQECRKKDAEIEQLKAERLQTAGEPEKENTQQENMHKPAKELETSELNQDNPETKTTPLEKQQLNIEEVKVFTHFSGNSNAFHQVQKPFIGTLRNQILNLREVDTLDESDINLIFCPVSQIETEIDAALKRLEGDTGSKLAVLVVLHPTTDPEKTVPDSSKYVKRTDILTVDCLFYEDTELLKCQKNSDAVDKVMNWLIQQGRKAGAEVCPLQNPVQEWDQERSHNSKKVEGESESVQRETSEPREKMEAEINNEFQIFFSKEFQSDSTIRCHLSLETSAVDMEIRWFKETDCVCFYKNGRLIEGESYKGIMRLCIEELERGIVSLQLKDVRESYVGDYLCQVTRGDRTAEITIRKSLKTHEDQNDMSQQITTPWTNQFEKIWTNEERIKMVNSALLAVFNSLEKTDPRKEDLQGINATVLQTDINIEENQDEAEEEKTQQEYKNGPMNESMSFSAIEMETSTCKPEEQETNPGNNISYLGNQQPGCSSQKLLESALLLNIPDVKVCIFRTEKTKNYDKDFTDILQSRIENLTEVPTVSQSDIILVFCPVVSRAGTDIDKALERFSHKTETKLGVLVVFHHTFDPEKVIPDSSRCVNRTDILTVDCVFNEDTGLLKCQKNSDAADKVVNWLIQQGRQTGVKIRPRQRQIQYPERERCKLNKKEGSLLPLNLKRFKIGNNEPSTKKVKVFSILAGKIKNCHKEFFTILRNQIKNLKEGLTVDESDIILVFCPIVSRAGTDIEAALNNFIYSSDSKLIVLVVLHHTFDPEKIVPNSSRCVNRTDILTVDCVFNEDTGLLKCQKNSDAADKTVNWLIQQGAKIGITILPCQYKSSSFTDVFTSVRPAWTVGPPKQKSNVQEMTCNSSRPVNYIIHVTKDTYKCDVDFTDALHKLVPLKNVTRMQESELILLFCPVCSPSDIKESLQEYHKRPDKPAVVIFLHETLDSNSVPNSSGYVKSQDVLVVDCIFCDGEGLPDCEKNREAISAVADWIKNKLRDH